MKKRFSQDIKIIFSALAIVLICFVMFNSSLTGAWGWWGRRSRRDVTCPEAKPVGEPYCMGNNVIQKYVGYKSVRRWFKRSCEPYSTVKVLQKCQKGCINAACKEKIICDNNLIFDENSDICMEEIVFNQINDIYAKAKICENCNDLPQPIISLDNGNEPAIYNLYLNGKKIRKFILPFPNVEKRIIYNPGEILSEPSWIKVDGTNSIKFLIPSEGNYFQNRYDILRPNQVTDIKYKIVKKQGNYGAAYFFVLENDITFNLDDTIQIFDNIAKDHSALASLKNTDPYYVIAMPSLFALLLGGEGNFYMGNHLITINYGGEKVYDLFKNEYNRDIFQNKLAHEYVHGLQETFGLWQKYQNGVFFMEGMADIVTVYNGYRSWEELGPFGEDIDSGCSHLPNQHVPHTLGRCIFKHIEQGGYLTEDFFYNLFHPINSYELIQCDISLQNTECTEELNSLLSYLTGQDMTLFMREELLANI